MIRKKMITVTEIFLKWTQSHIRTVSMWSRFPSRHDPEGTARAGTDDENKTACQLHGDRPFYFRFLHWELIDYLIAILDAVVGANSQFLHPLAGFQCLPVSASDSAAVVIVPEPLGAGP